MKFNIWLCEYCYKFHEDIFLPDNWILTFQSAVCPSCRIRVEKEGGYRVVKGGAFATGPDPRTIEYDNMGFSVGEIVRMKYGNILYPNHYDLFKIDRIFTSPRFARGVGVILSSVPCPFCHHENKVMQKQADKNKNGFTVEWLIKIDIEEFKRNLENLGNLGI